MKESILSVGIDIGTTTTQLIFTRITIDNTSPNFSVPKISIIDKQIVYKSGIYLTPFKSDDEIDGDGLREIVKNEYQKFGVSQGDIDTGAVIITGESAEKSNARLILDALSGFAGDFVVATAGGDLESIIAGKGSGAEKVSRDEGCTVANIDIGGGTTNIAIFKNGEVIDTVCLHIGGRLIRFDGEQRVAYISEKVRELAESSGIDIRPGMTYGAQVDAAVQRMAGILEEVLGIREETYGLQKMLSGHGFKRIYDIDLVMFSGGVADYIYNNSENNIFKFGDIGVLLGMYIKNSGIVRRFKVKVPSETIRATVVGAGSHTTDISGSTIKYTKDLFPLKNIPIVKINSSFESSGPLNAAEEIREKLMWYGDGCRGKSALAIKGVKNPGYEKVREIARIIAEGIDGVLDENEPLIVIVKNDMAKALGQCMYLEMGRKREVVCIDSISVENGDYIDIGRPVSNGRAIPVIIKTLVFNS